MILPFSAKIFVHLRDFIIGINDIRGGLPLINSFPELSRKISCLFCDFVSGEYNLKGGRLLSNTFVHKILGIEVISWNSDSLRPPKFVGREFTRVSHVLFG